MLQFIYDDISETLPSPIMYKGMSIYCLFVTRNSPKGVDQFREIFVRLSTRNNLSY